MTHTHTHTNGVCVMEEVCSSSRAGKKLTTHKLCSHYSNKCHKEGMILKGTQGEWQGCRKARATPSHPQVVEYIVDNNTQITCIAIRLEHKQVARALPYINPEQLNS